MEIQSDIIVFRNETSQELHGGDQFEFHFERPNEIVVDPGDNPPSYDYSLRFTIEGLTLDEDQNEGGIHLDMINTQEHPDVKYKIFNERQLQPSQIDVVITKDLFESGINTLRFRIDQAISSLTLSNFILWFGKQSFGVNVKAAPYFAKGDGATDDREAIQKAIDDLHHSPRGGGILYFPGGEYVIGSPGLVIPRGNQKTLIFRGEGVVATQLYGGNLDSFTPVIRYEDTDAPATNHQWEEMTIGRGDHGPVFIHSSHGDPQRAESCVFRNINFISVSAIPQPYDLDYVDGLNEGQVPENLREELNGIKLPLSSNTYVEVEQAGYRWRVVDVKPGGSNATELAIRKSDRDQSLHIHVGTGLTFNLEPGLTEDLIESLDGVQLSAIPGLFEPHNQNLSENAIIEVIRSGSRWKIIDAAKEYIIWKVDDSDNVGESRLFVYISQAMTRIEGMLHCVLDNVGVRGGVTALRLDGSHFTTMDLHTLDDFRQVNAVDVICGNVTMISTRIEACDGGFGLRLTKASNVILNGVWFEGEWTSRQIEIMKKSHNITILNPAFGQPTQDYCIGLLVHGGAANVRVIGGDAGADFKTCGEHNYMLKVESGAKQVLIERLNGPKGKPGNDSGSNYWFEDGAVDVVMRLNINGAQGDRTSYSAGLFNNDQPRGILNVASSDLFYINGGEIDNIREGYESQVIRLLFSNGNATVRSCTGNIRLSNNVHFISTKNATLSLICDGQNWYEIGRSSGGECPPRPIPPIPQDVLPNDWLGKAIIRINDFWMRLRNWIRDMLVPPRIG
ncbi:MAG: hypothetical protein JNK77_03980 [Saprospiraceae bacterium]|nr:hypothetical protein [Saprospiraceae bacterium]